MRVVFLGTPEFARTVLAGLLKAGIEVPLVVTQPDRVPQRRGRGAKPQPSPVARFAKDQGLAVRSPKGLDEISKELRGAAPDAFVVASFGQIIPSGLLELGPRWVNVHASLLPKYRGASPIAQAILDGETGTGVSLMQVTAGLDEGPVYSASAVRIADDDTAGTLSDKLASAGAAALKRSLPKIIDGSLRPVPQDDASATYAEKLTKGSGRIDWQKDAVDLERFVRAMQPWPGAWTEADGRRLVILEMTPAPVAPGNAKKSEPGTFDGPPLRVGTGRGVLRIERLKPAGKNPLAGDDWLRGWRGGKRFG